MDCRGVGIHTFIWAMQDFLGVVHTVPIKLYTCPIQLCALLPLALEVIRYTLKQCLNFVFPVSMAHTDLGLICVDLHVFCKVIHRIEGSPAPQPQTTRLSQPGECQVDDILKFLVWETNRM